jgi:hypothetical protein
VEEADRFLEAVQDLPKIQSGQLGWLNPAVPLESLVEGNGGIL